MTTIRRLTIATLIALAVLITLFGDASAQTPGSYISAGPIISHASSFGYKVPGIGGNVSAGFKLGRFYLTDDLVVMREVKTYLHDGRTVSNTVGLQYHRGQWFARAAFDALNHVNSDYSKTVMRYNLGGGWAYYQGSELPRFAVTAVGFGPISDPNGVRGVKVSGETFYGRRFGIHLRGGITAGSFEQPAGSGIRYRGNYGEVQVNLFVRLGGGG